MGIHDYEAGQDITVDPTDPNETVTRKLLDKLALTITRAEEAILLDGTTYHMNPNQKKERFVAMIDDPEVSEFLDQMRKSGRCAYRKWGIGS